MQVAIIEDNVTYQNFLKQKIIDHNIQHPDDNFVVDFFRDNKEFGKVPLDKFDIIISNVYLPEMKGTELFESIKDKTNASLALMSSKNGWLKKEIMEDDRIVTIIDKNTKDGVLIWLKYMNSRKNIENYNLNSSSAYEQCNTSLKQIKD